jgi:ribosome-associated protein
MAKSKTLTSRQKAKWLFETAMDKKPENPVVLDARGVSPLWDFFIILTAGSDRQAEAISSHVVRMARDEKMRPHHVEIDESGGWVLLDFNDVVVHIFSEEKRDFYGIERLLNDARKVNFKISEK